MSAYVVTGTDTGTGKTVFCAALTGALRAYYWKPIQSGLDAESDSETVARLAGVPAPQILAEAYRLTKPLSPHFAAEFDGIEIDADRLALPEVRPLVIEAAGGALVPVTREFTFADVFAEWGLLTIIVARTAPGTINHTLMTIEALRARRVPIHGVAFVGEKNLDTEIMITEMGKVRRLGRLPRIPHLTATALAAAFAEGFCIGDFT